MAKKGLRKRSIRGSSPPHSNSSSGTPDAPTSAHASNSNSQPADGSSDPLAGASDSTSVQIREESKICDGKTTPSSPNGTPLNSSYSSIYDTPTNSSTVDTISNENDNNSLQLSTNNQVTQNKKETPATTLCVLPYAPSIQEYMKDEGHLRYVPRPEWIFPYERLSSTHEENVAQDEGNRNGKPGESVFSVDNIEVVFAVSGDGNGASIPAVVLNALEGRNDANVMGTSSTTNIFSETTSQISQNFPLTPVETPITGQNSTDDNANGALSLQNQNQNQNQNQIQNPNPNPNPNPNQYRSEWLGSQYTFDTYGTTALIMAAKLNAVPQMKQLLSLGADVNETNTKGCDALQLACHKGSLEAVKLLLGGGANVNSRNYTGSSPLIQASHFGHPDVVDYLVDHGADVNQPNEKLTTALMRACQEGHVRIAKTLLEAGADPDARNKERMNSLMLSAQRGHVEIVKLLVARGAELNGMTEQLSTALMLAVKRGNVAVVEELVHGGAEFFFRDARGKTAIDIAKHKAKNEPEFENIVTMLDYDYQMLVIRRQVRRQLLWIYTKIYILMLQDRARVKTIGGGTTIDGTIKLIKEKHARVPRDLFLVVKAFYCLPAELIRHVLLYIPLPFLDHYRIERLHFRCNFDHEKDTITSMVSGVKLALEGAFSMIDDILHRVGFDSICADANIDQHEESWSAVPEIPEGSSVCETFHGSNSQNLNDTDNDGDGDGDDFEMETIEGNAHAGFAVAVAVAVGGGGVGGVKVEGVESEGVGGKGGEQISTRILLTAPNVVPSSSNDMDYDEMEIPPPVPRLVRSTTNNSGAGSGSGGVNHSFILPSTTSVEQNSPRTTTRNDHIHDNISVNRGPLVGSEIEPLPMGNQAYDSHIFIDSRKKKPTLR